jgi:hypothetical protein
LNALPIIDRELRRMARNRRTYRARAGAGGSALVVCVYLIWLAREMTGGPGAGFFVLRIASYMVLTLSVLNALGRTCDALSSEKREETLGLLYLTELKSSDIVLGKLAVAALDTLLTVISVIPILSVPIMLGGISSGELLRVPLAIIMAIFLALSIGLIVSSVCTRHRASFSIASGVMGLVTMVLPGFAVALDRKGILPGLSLALRLPSPASALEMAFMTGRGLSTTWFGTAMAIEALIIASMLAGACWLLPRAWKGAPRGSRLTLWKERFRQWSFGSNAERKERRRRLLAKNPILWLNCRNRLAPLAPLIFAGLVYGIILFLIVYYQMPREAAFAMFFAGAALNDLGMRIRVASLASVRLAEDRQSGALELILSTEISVKQIVAGVWMAIRRTLLPAYIALFIIFLSVGVFYSWRMDQGNDSAAVIIFFMLISMGDFINCGYAGIWKAMKVQNTLHAPGAALMRVSILPWLAFFLSGPIIHQFPGFRQWFDRNAPYSFFGIVLLFWSVSSITAFRQARRHIEQNFRAAAADRYSFDPNAEPPSWFARGVSAAREFVAGIRMVCAKLGADDGERSN